MQILDHNGNPIDTGRLREPQTSHVATLHNEFADHPASGLTPARLHQVMRAAEQGDWLGQLDLADDMEERNGHLFAELQKRTLAIVKLSWDVQPPKDASAAEKRATDQVREWLTGLPDFEDLLAAMMDAVLKSFSPIEMVWSKQERFLLPSKFEPQPQRWFQQDQATRREIRLRNPGFGVDGEPLKPFGWINHIHRSRNGYLARAGLVRMLAWPHLFYSYAERDLAEFLEIYGLPLRVGKYPTGATDEEKRRLLQAVVSIGHNAAGVIPQGMQIDFENAAQGTQVPFMAMIDLMQAVISKVILGQTLTAGEGKHGTQALGEVHNEVRLDIRDADARQTAATITSQLIWPMVALNIGGIDPRRSPHLQFDTREPEDLAAYAEALPKLAQAGLRISVKWVHEQLHIPQAAEGEELLQAPAPPPQLPGPDDLDDPNQPGAKKKPEPSPAKPPKTAKLSATDPEPGQDVLDPLIDEGASAWQEVMTPMIEPLVAELDRAIEAGESLESFRDRLPELVERMDGRPLADRLGSAMFVARLTGEADLQVDENEGG